MKKTRISLKDHSVKTQILYFVQVTQKTWISSKGCKKMTHSVQVLKEMWILPKDHKKGRILRKIGEKKNVKLVKGEL